MAYDIPFKMPNGAKKTAGTEKTPDSGNDRADPDNETAGENASDETDAKEPSEGENKNSGAMNESEMGATFASALKGGNGQAIYDAFARMMSACK
jgi:hypothetical protein